MSTVPERVGSVSFEVAASQSVGGPAANSLPLVLGSVLVVAFSALFARPWWNRYLGLTNEGWYQFFGSQIVQGRIPYRDFHLFVPPGQALVMAALTAIFGPRLIVAEVFRVHWDRGDLAGSLRVAHPPVPFVLGYGCSGRNCGCVSAIQLRIAKWNARRRQPLCCFGNAMR